MLRTPEYILKLYLGLATLPLLVVTRITPPAAREPYNEADAASFSTSIDSTSPIFTDAKPSGIGNPSTTTNGPESALIEPNPRTRIVGDSPASGSN